MGGLRRLFFFRPRVVVVTILGTFCAVAVFVMVFLLYDLMKAVRRRGHLRRDDLEGQEKYV